MITDAERRWKVGDSAELANNLTRETLAQVQVVEGESASAKPILLKCLGGHSREGVDEPGATRSEFAERSGNDVVFIVEIPCDDEGPLSMGVDLLKVILQPAQILGRVAYEIACLVLSVGQIQPYYRRNQTVFAPYIGGGERTGEVRVEFVVAKTGDSLDAQVASRDDGTPSADIGESARSVRHGPTRHDIGRRGSRGLREDHEIGREMMVRPLPELAVVDLFLTAIDPSVEIPRGDPNRAHTVRARTNCDKT